MIPQSRHASLIDALLPEAMRRLHPFLRQSVSEDELRVGLAVPVQDALDRAANRAGAARWKASCPALPATVDDLLAREVVVGGGLAFLELRFRGLDPEFPFVEVIGTDFPVDATTLPTLMAAAKRSWPAVPFRWLGLWVSPHAGWAPRGQGDMHLVVGTLDALDLTPGPLTTTLATPESLPRILSAYTHFHAANPILAPNVAPLEAEDLAAMIAAGTAVDAWLDGAWAGLFAVKSSPLLGRAGWVIYEEILAPEFRGRRLGAALQRAGLAVLPRGEDRLVWGTIHDRNLPSRRTAARVGRQEVDQRWLVPIS